MSNAAAEAAREKARQEIAKLVAKYRSLPDTSKKKYTEADTKTVFIERLFAALGWDVYGGEEVSQEQRASRGRVDYAFRLQGIPKFFLEAKPLKADLDNPEYAKQVINYAWHKDVTWAVLTNFEGLKVSNAEWKEAIVSRSQFFELKCDEYLSRFDWLWLLSRPACEQNLLDKRALEDFKKTKKTPVGQQLFSDLVSWRNLLAKYLSRYNKQYTPYLIDEAVQRILDRLIFIRTCEDRGIEQSTLRSLLREWKNGARKDLVQELRHIWRDFDEGYDSRLFLSHLADELECEPTPFEEVISELYSTKDGSIQYDFNAIDADILGGIYEQYLQYLIKRAGKEIEVTPERGKRKAQGIYYTPKFVVRYIVENTLGPALRGKSLSEARKIRILDPACGSGSFLVEALDYLEKHWRQQKWIPQPMSKEDTKQTDFFDYVTKVQFLTENIYGVDLDAQAVEIAQLNLLLQALNQRHRLPDLVNRISQGNSLISGTEDELKRYFGKNWRQKKPFNWKERFEDIMAKGGFDVVIGNPPWVSLTGKHKSLDLPPEELRYLFDNFTVSTYAPNLYEIFIWRSLELLKEGGLFSFVLPDRLATNQQFVELRRYILCNFTLEKVLFRAPFPGVIADTMIFVIRKARAKDNNIEISDYTTQKVTIIPQRSLLCSSDFSFFFVAPKVAEIFEKIRDNNKVKNLNSIAKSTSGCGAKSALLHKKRVNRKEIKVIKGENVGRYENRGFFWFEFNDEHLTGRTRDTEKLGTKEKVLIRKTGGAIIATFDDSGIYPEQSLYFLYGVNRDMLLYLLSLLNSKLMNVYYRNFAVTNRDTTPQLKNIDLDRFPIVVSPAKKMHDDLVALAGKQTLGSYPQYTLQ